MVDAGVAAYIAAIPPEHRPLFVRLHAIVLAGHPDADVALSYGMPAYRVGDRRLNLGEWNHGVSVYGFRGDNDSGFVQRHPKRSSGKGTIRIRPAMPRGSPTRSCGRCWAARSSTESSSPEISGLVALDEDALAGALLGGLDHRVLQVARHRRHPG
jgi:hypothetical protein